IRTNSTLSVSEIQAALRTQRLGVHLISNDISFRDITEYLYNILSSMGTNSKYYYLEEVYDDYFVYCEVLTDGSSRTLFKQGYSIGQDGKVEITSDPVKVRKEVSYISVSQKLTRNKSKSTMKTNKKCTCSVDSLIQNEATNFTEEDREWLEALS